MLKLRNKEGKFNPLQENEIIKFGMKNRWYRKRLGEKIHEIQIDQYLLEKNPICNQKLFNNENFKLELVTQDSNAHRLRS